MYQIVNYYQENVQAITDFKLSSRFLWDDHISYTRNAIVSILSGLPDINTISLRLNKNQEDIGDFIKPYYSTQQVSTFVDLLKQHISIAVDVVNGVEGAEEMWRTNGDNITSQMQQMNPMFWPVSLTSPIWSEHLDMTIAQVTARKNELWNDDISFYDSNHQHISRFADLFSNGVIYQNIGQFCLGGDRHEWN